MNNDFFSVLFLRKCVFSGRGANFDDSGGAIMRGVSVWFVDKTIAIMQFVLNLFPYFATIKKQCL